jgi:acetyl esterase/lipase
MPDPAIQRLTLKTVLGLPAPLLRAVAGGGVVYRGGRTLDPRLQFLWKAWSRPRAMAELTPEEARAGWRELTRTAGLKPDPSVRSETVLLDGPASVLTTGLYTPAALQPGAPMLVFLHGGMGVAGDLETADGLCRRLAADAGCLVLAPEYRLAPEHRFPAALDDALAVVRWAQGNAGRYGAAGVAVGGESLGGGLAAAVCQALRQEGEPQPLAQLLICPLLDAAAQGGTEGGGAQGGGAMETYADAWPLSREGLDWALGHYLKPEDDPADPRVSPLREPDLTGLAPAVIAAAGFDPLGDQAEAYARRLRDAGVEVRYRRYDSLTHAFPSFAGLAPAAEAAVRDVAALLRGRFA